MNWSLRSEDGVAIIHLQKRRDLGNCYQYMVDRGLTASYTIACDALGYTLPLLEVNVMQPEPAYAERYQEIFRCPVNFSAGSNDFRFEEQQAETESSRIFEAQCEQICAALDEGGGFTEVIRQHLLQLPNQVSSLERIAERLHTTPRTIQRKREHQLSRTGGEHPQEPGHRVPEDHRTQPGGYRGPTGLRRRAFLQPCLQALDR
jgi:hypothetical protein